MKKVPVRFYSPRLAAALVCLFVNVFSNASFAGSRVVDQSFIDTSAMPTKVSMDPYYDWVDVPIGHNINVALYFHSSSDPMPMMPVANAQPGVPTLSGFVDDNVVASVDFDPILSCTRFVMTVNGLVEAQDFKDHAGTYCRDNFTAFNTLPLIPKGRVTDQSFVDTSAMPAWVSLDPYYEWADVPIGHHLNVALYFHSSSDPMPMMPVANAQPGVPALSGFVDGGVVASVNYDPVLSCTRFVMTVNGLVVAQDFKDHAGTYCLDNFGAFDTLQSPASVPTLNTVGIAILTLTMATLGALVARRSGGGYLCRWPESAGRDSKP